MDKRVESYDIDEVTVAFELLEITEDESCDALSDHRNDVGMGQFRYDLIRDIAPKLNLALNRALEKEWDDEASFTEKTATTHILSHAEEVHGVVFGLPQSGWDKLVEMVYWLASFEAELLRQTSITVEDTGIDPVEMFQRFGDEGEIQYRDAVQNYAEKYDLALNTN